MQLKQIVLRLARNPVFLKVITIRYGIAAPLDNDAIGHGSLAG